MVEENEMEARAEAIYALEIPRKKRPCGMTSCRFPVNYAGDNFTALPLCVLYCKGEMKDLCNTGQGAGIGISSYYCDLFGTSR